MSWPARTAFSSWGRTESSKPSTPVTSGWPAAMRMAALRLISSATGMDRQPGLPQAAQGGHVRGRGQTGVRVDDLVDRGRISGGSMGIRRSHGAEPTRTAPTAGIRPGRWALGARARDLSSIDGRRAVGWVRSSEQSHRLGHRPRPAVGRDPLGERGGQGFGGAGEGPIVAIDEGDRAGGGRLSEPRDPQAVVAVVTMPGTTAAPRPAATRARTLPISPPSTATVGSIPCSAKASASPSAGRSPDGT